MPNTLIADRYELFELRGRGTVGQVYRAYDHLMERHVAFKMPISDNKHGLLAGIQHSQIPACYDCCQIDETSLLSLVRLEAWHISARQRARISSTISVRFLAR